MERWGRGRGTRGEVAAQRGLTWKETDLFLL